MAQEGTSGSAHGGSLYIPTLDGFRAIAVGIVFFSHVPFTELSFIPGGFGVTVFFVLSGYLITTLLMSELERTETVSYKAFMVRRALRILPPLYLTIGLGLLMVAIGIVEAPHGLAGTWSQLLHFANYYIAGGGEAIMDGTEVTWSLAVEEHFYLLYPLGFLALMRWRGARSAAWALMGLSAFVLVWRLLLAGSTVDEAEFFSLAYRTDTRIDSILWGCALALVANPLQRAVKSDRRDFVLLCIAVFALALTIAPQGFWYKGTVRFTLQPILLAVVYWLVIANPRLWVHRLLELPIMRFLGRISYTLYLTSHMITIVCFRYIADTGWRDDVDLLGGGKTTELLLALVASIIGSILAGLLMERFVERPLLAVRRRWRDRDGTKFAVPVSAAR